MYENRRCTSSVVNLRFLKIEDLIIRQLSAIFQITCHHPINNQSFLTLPVLTDLAPIGVPAARLQHREDADLVQPRRWLRNHCPPEYSRSELMPSLIACRSRLHVDLEKCENSRVPCGVGLLPCVLEQSHFRISSCPSKFCICGFYKKKKHGVFCLSGCLAFSVQDFIGATRARTSKRKHFRTRT